MKKLLTMITSIVIILAYSLTTYGQKIMKLDNELKSNSKPMEAKRKGISSIGKYEFGPYKIVSGKAGWTTTKSNKKFFSFETQSESKKKSSFVFVANDKDTILVNTSTNAKFSETELGNMSWLNNRNENYVAIIAPAADTTEWRMILVSNSGEAIKGNFQASGILTNGVTNIQIIEVKQWEDGKTPTFKMICGYEFIMDNKSIAAVQSSLDTFQKKFVWLLQDLDERMKSVLAAASASLMIHTDDALATSD
jgi:hypothetical protein